MNQEASTGLIATLSGFVGASEPALRLLIAVLAGYPLAWCYRTFIYGKPASIQHLFCILSGFALGFWNYEFDIFHAVAAIAVTYGTLFILGGTALSVGIVFVYTMTHLLIGYYCTGTDDYDINWTMPQCVLVLRLIGVAFDYYDGQQPPEKLSTENKKVALTQCPNILEFFGYSLFPGSFMVGPQFPMKRYQDFVAGKFSDNDSPPASEKAAINRFGLGVIYLMIFQTLGMFVSDDYLVSDEYANLGFIRRYLLMGVWGRFTLYKYISCWLLTEGACIYFGVTYNDKDEHGQTLWNGVENVKLSVFENTTEFNHYIQSFNINTNHWVAQYIYKRLKFLGNRQISQLSALLFLSIWHGFHSGYYVCFLFEFLVVYLERDVKSIVKSNEKLEQFFENPTVAVVLHLALRLYTFVFMGWCLMPFALLKFERYWKSFAAVNYCGIVVFVLWPFIYSPAIRFLSKKREKAPEHLE